MEGVTGQQQAHKNMHAGIDFEHLQGQSQGQSYARINPPKDVAREAEEIMDFLKTIRVQHRGLRDSAESFSQHEAAQILSSCNDKLLAFCLANKRKFMPEAGQRTLKLEKEREEDQKLIQHLEAKVAKLDRELKEALKTKESALNRLSEVQSRLLKQGNPEIADLSDENRPTNLGQRFKQLYEDEWTDAFEFLTEKMATDFRVDDRKAISILYEMLKRCKELCAKEQAAQHLELAKLVTDQCFFKGVVAGELNPKPQSAPPRQGGNDEKLKIMVQSVHRQGAEPLKPQFSKTLPSRPGSNDGQLKGASQGGKAVNKNAQPGTKRSSPSQMSDVYDAGQMPEMSRTSTVADVHKIPEQYNTLFKDFFKGIADETLKYLPMTELVVEINTDGLFQHDILQNPEIRTYLQKCFNICWLMLAQHPPMLMDFETRSGHTLDINVFEPYSSRGPIISQVVWPPVYLHKGGPLVCKGYAEGSKKQ
ncbi:uncharacterized protein LOC132732032 isoform X2 [Ruditapes philippinarum]|uniref:uncharacterized protein LOC132732032 isoform X2 n=1 Tax=Ruditapes philippinarum TaxID=129788 RepID=UPI00295B6E54|nr:uncharacterized protein LOC132732032 isoform X2 [Ruditapes philippinarum]